MLAATKGPYLITVQPDEMAQSPREDDNFGTMVCFHRRYSLGDRHNYLDNDDFLREMYLDVVGNDERGARRYERMLDMVCYRKDVPYGTREHQQAVDEALMNVIGQKYLMLPLYLYDHSGLTMNTTGFSCPWDSGQVGWVYASKEDALKEFGGKVLTAEKREKAESLMRGEVAYYDSYLRGECYGYELYKDGDLEDSCWGFIGSLDEVREAMEEYLPDGCRGITENLKEQDGPRSMIKLLMSHARQQIDQAVKDHERGPRQQALAAEAR